MTSCSEEYKDYCPNCGHLLRGGELRCPHCGYCIRCREETLFEKLEREAKGSSPKPFLFEP